MIAVALVALGLVLYTYLGYPLLIAVLASLFPRASGTRDDRLASVTICLPVHNGGAAAEVPRNASDVPAPPRRPRHG